MYSVPVILINPIKGLDLNVVGTAYVDELISVKKSDDIVESFMTAINPHIDKDSSIILYRQDVRAFADKIGGKEAFRQIKAVLRDKYTVLKLKYNPRTQEFCGLKTAFIIHKK